MRKSIIVLMMLLATALSQPAWAKKRDRAPKQSGNDSWEQRKEALKPAQLKELIEENHQLKAGKEEMEGALATLTQLKKKIDALRKKRGLSEGEDLEALFGQSMDHSQGISELGEFTKDDWMVDETGNYYIKGLVFKVQIGAYRNRDLSNVMEEGQGPEAFEQEKIIGLNVYTIRHFRNYKKANKFKKELRALGIKDAYIVCFVDGKRVPLKSVLSQVKNQVK